MDTASEKLRTSARRRLLRGTFSVPMVATLHSGSALAASSAMRTFQNLPTGVAPIAHPAPASETFWRVATYTVGGTTYFKGSDLAPYEALIRMSPKGYVSRFASGKLYHVAEPHNEAASNVDISAAQPTGQLVGVRVQHDPSNSIAPGFVIVGVADQPGESGTARVMSHSCWTSVI